MLLASGNHCVFAGGWSDEQIRTNCSEEEQPRLRNVSLQPGRGVLSLPLRHGLRTALAQASDCGYAAEAFDDRCRIHGRDSIILTICGQAYLPSACLRSLT